MRDEGTRRREGREARDALVAARQGEAPATTAGGPSVTFAIDSRVLGWVVAAFLAGILIGVAVLFGYAWVSVR
jgi:hypothetical protein